MKKVLWLASWYPNDLAPLEGDFIQRHARSVSLYHEVEVIFVVRDAEGKITRDVKRDIITEPGLTQQIIYYYTPKLWSASVNRLYSQLKYQRIFKKYITEYIAKNGKPSIVHVHTGMKAGLPGLWLKRKYGVPYVVTEHWTGFLPEASQRIDQLSSYLQKKWKELWENAAGISVVSAYLKQQIGRLGWKHVPVIIPNVVNTALFFPVDGVSNTPPRFIHISGLGFQKDPETILKAFSLLLKSNTAFHLDIFAPADAAIAALAKELGLMDHVSFHAEMPQAELAVYVRQSDALVLFSRYETFGCVVIEALASGLPVIISDMPVMHELVVEGRNGMFAEKGSAEALADKLGLFLQHREIFNRKRIAEECASKYNYSVVGKMFTDWYEQVLTNK